MNARDMMQVDLITATPEMSLAQGQRLMHEKGIRHLLIVSDDHLVGIVTDRDIRDATPSPATTLSKGEINYQMDTTPIRTCMIHRVMTTTPDDYTTEVARIMAQHQFGCIPVVDGKRLVGMITATDCLQAYVISHQNEDEPPVKDYMQTDVITAVPETLVSAVFQQMRGCHVRHVPVVTEWKQLVGLVSDRDIRQAGASDDPHLSQYDLNHLLQKMTVNTIMAQPVYTVTRETMLTTAGQLLLAHKIGCLPVVRDDNILDGVITVTDLLRAYGKQRESSGQAS